LLLVADPITVEFELGADDVTKALGLRSERRGGFYTAAVMIVAGGVCLALYEQGDRPKMWMPAALLGLYAVFTLFYALVYLPRKTRANVNRLVGGAQVNFADDGVRYRQRARIGYSGGSVARGYSWPKVSSVTEQPAAWVITAGKKAEGFVIPKQAVPEEQIADLAASLREWSGKAYKVRKR
jgi:hypothetical protein